MEERTSQEPTRKPQGKSALRNLLEFLGILLVAFVLVFGFVRPFVVEAFVIPSASMEPTLHGCTGCNNDRVLANKFIYRFTDPERGDVVIFDVPFQQEPLIKRVVGLPGDRIEVRNGKLFVNGEPQKEPYIADRPCIPGRLKTCSFGPVTVPKDHVFAMGDNRANSEDSRFIGAIPEQNIEGEAFLRFWPPGRIGLL